MKLMLSGKCPRCGKGAVFKYPLRNIFHFAEMHDECPECHATYQPEPGFYFGAMFVSYAFTVVIMFIDWLILYILVHPSTTTFIYFFLVTILLAMPISFRYSRLVWLHWFGGYTRKP